MIDSWHTESEFLGNLKASIIGQNLNQEQNRLSSSERPSKEIETTYKMEKIRTAIMMVIIKTIIAPY